MTKFRAVWEDSSDTEADDDSIVEITPPRMDKGKGRAVTIEDEESEVDEELLGDDDGDMEGILDETPTKTRPSGHALVPDERGDFVHPHETEAATRETTPDSSTPSKSTNSDKENQPERRSSPIPWPARIGVEPHRVHIMQQSFFHTQSMPNVNGSSSKPTVPRSTLFLLPQQKHNRASEIRNMTDPGQRASFGHSILNQPPRPIRKFTRVSPSISLTLGNEGVYNDLGLSMGRSFRVGWGPGGTIAHVGTLSGILVQKTDVSSPTVITVEKLKMSPYDDKVEQDRSNHLLAAVSEFAQIHLDLDTPFAALSPAFRFSHLSALFPPSDHSHEANLWRLGAALFDDVELDLSRLPLGTQKTIERIQRKDAASDWLENSVRDSVEADLRMIPSGESRAAKLVFSLLSGNQIERACEEAFDGKLINLSTLIAQAGDFLFREELIAQLEIWNDQKVEDHIHKDILKIYEVLAGRLVVEGVNGDCLLDWKRALGLRMWFGQTLDGENGLSDVIEEYDELYLEGRCPIPRPWYIETSSNLAKWKTPVNDAPLDSHYLLLKLATDSSIPLESVLSAQSYSPSPLDGRLPFFVSILLSRAIRYCDFSDREDVDTNIAEEDSGEFSGASAIAGRVIEGYAAMLENMGSVKEAVFVLLFLEAAPGRKKAITELLSRQAHLLNEDLESEILKFQVSPQWIYEAKATRLLYEGEIYEGFECALKAGLQSFAHNLAVNHLAPEVVLRGDMRLLRYLFARFIPREVDGWSTRGKLYLDYANIINLLDEQAEGMLRDDRPAVPDAVEAAELARLALELPKLIPLIPDIGGRSPALIYRAAVQCMSNELAKRQTQLEGLGSTQGGIIVGKLIGAGVDDSTRLNHVKAKAYHRFMQSISAVA